MSFRKQVSVLLNMAKISEINRTFWTFLNEYAVLWLIDQKGIIKIEYPW